MAYTNDDISVDKFPLPDDTILFINIKVIREVHYPLFSFFANY